MNQVRTGEMIRALRQQQQLTQLALAERLHISDKTVSKWERGCGAPDVSLLPQLAEALQIDMEVLLKGELPSNRQSSGNLSRVRFYRCGQCGNLLFSTDGVLSRCCGRRLAALVPKAPDKDHMLDVTRDGEEWYITSSHPMEREHALTLLALVSGDTVLVRRLYPEWNVEVRLPYLPNASLLWCCTNHGLFWQRLKR